MMRVLSPVLIGLMLLSVHTEKTMKLTLEKNFLNIPVKAGADKGWLSLTVDGKAVKTFEVEIAPGKPDFWANVDIRAYKGKEAVLRMDQLPEDSEALEGTTQSDEAKSLEGAYQESLRPQFHFSPRRGWTNDPNGLVYYKGEYHLFFQHNPFGTGWGNMTWGHAVSRNLVHWQELPPAIEPDNLGAIFSGSAVVDTDNTAGFQKGAEKPIVAIYTAAGGSSPESEGQPFTQCLAYSTDRGRTWSKYEGNPVLKHIVGANRDPKVAWHAPTRRWVMALFLDGHEYGFFASPDLKEWDHLHNIAVPGCGECPDFFETPVDGESDNRKWVWTAANGMYLVGSFDGQKFVSETPLQQADYGANYYAVQSYSDMPPSDGRRIQIAWMNGGSYPGMPFNQQMSFPCELTLRAAPDGLRLFRWPVKEIRRLYRKTHRWKNIPLNPDEPFLPGLSGSLFDIRAEFEAGDAAGFGFRIGGASVLYRVQEKTLSCLSRSAPLEPEKGRIRLRLLVDRASLELFGNGGRVSMTSCFLPGEGGLEMIASGGPAKVVSLEISEMHSAW
ncbi:MAG: GH32 C-terminal domain-containing protein [Armatimonadetes bacterium]|nr:GH32 C-terminal domain-containing protein [Armatimonadota bacterium]